MSGDGTFTFQELASSGFPMLEYAPDATVITDGEGRICLVNAQAERLFGYYREEMIGQPIEMLIPPRYRAKHVGERSGYFGDPHVRPMGVGLELHGLRKNGTEFPVEISLSPIVTRDHEVFVCGNDVGPGLAKVGKRFKRSRAHAGLMLADAAREDDAIDAAKHRRHRSDALYDQVDEKLERLRRAKLPGLTLSLIHI